jgi:glutamyl-tRNA reductase
MPLHVLGISHHSAPIDVREKLAFDPARQPDALAELVAQPGVSEAVLVSTCNRTEVYVRADDPAVVAQWLCDSGKRVGIEVAPHLYRHEGSAVVRHAFRVACGLDSMVLGEPQILGQVKHSVRTAEAAGTLGQALGAVFRKSFAVAKEVRTDTALGGASISVAAAALRLAQNIFGDLSRTRMLMVGVGEIVELAATYFAAQRPATLMVANRTLSRAEEFAARFSAQAMPLEGMPSRLAEFDIVVAGTASPHPIVMKADVERALKARRRRPMFMVDLAVPRDIDAQVRSLEDVFLYTLDDLGEIAAQGAEARRTASADAEAIVTRRVAEHAQWEQSRAAVPVIVELRRRADEYREVELAKARSRLARGDAPEAVLESLARGLANKFLHHPSQALGRAAEGERAALARAIETLYPALEERDASTE